MKKYAPQDVIVMNDETGTYWTCPVQKYILHPPGTHPRAPIVGKFFVLECVTEKGSRFYGVDGGEIDSTLRMVVWGGYVNPRNEDAARWQDAA